MCFRSEGHKSSGLQAQAGSQRGGGGQLQGPFRAKGVPPLNDSHSPAQHGSGGRIIIPTV